MRRQADELKRRFNEAYWMPDLAFLAMALDPEGRQVRSIASNALHCMAMGIVDADLAPKVNGTNIEGLAALPGVRMVHDAIDTNIVFFDIANSGPGFNITTGQDRNLDRQFNERPSFAGPNADCSSLTIRTSSGRGCA